VEGYRVTIEKKRNRITFEILQSNFCNLPKKARYRIEGIDIYQGRVPTSVFAAHYLKTNIEEDRQRVLSAVNAFIGTIINRGLIG
jgi:hypothetical protein